MEKAEEAAKILNENFYSFGVTMTETEANMTKMLEAIKEVEKKYPNALKMLEDN